MIRPLGPLIAMVALAGCQQPGPAVDPFLYRSTIPPPGTALPAGPTVTPGPQPYYTAPPATAVSPSPCAPGIAPPIAQPAPVVPAPAPVVPVLPPRNFPQRGGFDFPQSSNGPPPASGVSVAAIPAAAGNATTSNVAAAGSQPSVIRIIEPPAQRAALPTDFSAKPIVTSGTPTNPSPATLASPSMPSPTVPNASGAPAVLPASAALPLSAATAIPAATSVNYPGDHPGLTYGYDPGYAALRGKLDYSVTARLWRLRYLPPDGPIDEYGGNVVIADSRQANGFEPGDFVTVEGALSPPAASGASATYAIMRIKRQ